MTPGCPSQNCRPPRTTGYARRFPAPALAAALALSLLAACQAPRPVSFGSAPLQPRIASAAHWKVLADDVAGQVSLGLDQAQCGTSAVYVDRTAGTEFGAAFHNMLVTSLVNRGVHTLESPKPDALAVSFVTQIVYHNRQTRKHFKPEEMTLLTLGVYVTRQIFEWSSLSGQILGLGALASSFSLIDEVGGGALGEGVPQTEVVISVSLVRDGRYLMRKTDCYYIDDADFGLYLPAPEARTIRLSR